MRLSSLLILALLSFNLVGLYSQDSEFSQFFANPLYLNPAFASNSNCPQYRLNVRNPIPYIGLENKLISLSYNQNHHILSGGAGIIFNHDRPINNYYNKSNLGAIYSYSTNITRKTRYKIGFQVSYYYEQINGNSLVFPSMIDPDQGSITHTKQSLPESKGFFDYSLGALIGNDKYFIGASCFHLTEPKELINTNNLLERKYILHTGWNIPLYSRYKGNGLWLRPNIVYRKQSNNNQLSTGAFLSHNQFSFGLWTKQNLTFDYLSLVFVLGINIKEFSIGYSYEFLVTNTNISRKKTNVHEFSLLYTMKCKVKKPIRAIKCPDF